MAHSEAHLGIQEPLTAADEYVAGAARAFSSLAQATETLVTEVHSATQLSEPVDRGYFRPSEEAALLAWFARFVTVRSALWELLAEASSPINGALSRVVDQTGWRCFVLGYAAACQIVQLDRHLVESVAVDSLVQRKLNEGSAAHRIPRKQFTAVFESFTDASKALAMDEAMRFARRQRELLHAMADDALVGSVAAQLASLESVLDPSRRRYGSRLLAYLKHALRRRGASARQHSLFTALEAAGRLVSEVNDHWTPPAVNAELRAKLATILRPGDVLVTRHERALTNLFLPGYWPHAALYVGTEHDREQMRVALDPHRERRWCDDRCVLEALKDGVLFRALESTLAVDAVAVIRPSLEPAEIAVAIGRAIEHEGKGYNFDFDFFRSDHLVCTEVIYRAFDGVGEIDIPLHERADRPTLSAEDLLDLALDARGFTPVAVAGLPVSSGNLVVGPDSAATIATTYR